MRNSEDSEDTLSLVSSILILCAGCIGYLIWKQWLFLAGGLIGFTLLFVLKD